MASDKRTILASVLLTVIFIGILKPISAQWLVDDEGCRTPNRGVGTCIPIKECKPIVEYIQQAAQAKLSSSSIQLLQRYQCGFEGNSVKVCCPDDPNSIGKIPPPDISKHENLGLLPFTCGLHTFKDRIIGGNKTSLFEYPWMALLNYNTGSGTSFRCGGTVINDRYILTAAHCLTNLKTLKLVSVRLGEHDINTERDCEKSDYGDEYCSDPVQDIDIEESIPHPDYNATVFTSDIGLIRLAKPINISVESVRPICLPTTKELKEYKLLDTKLIVTGWGATETGRRSSVLLYVNVPVITEEVCRKAYEASPAKINYKQICAGGQNGMDSCGGDSGGPLQNFIVHNGDLRGVQFGVVSFGPRFCGQEGFPGVYTRIDYYMDWILNTLRR
ncbi:hypothetical protein ILUMI_09080 [Ignelater luminosus]|uniref:CLIP domain-containing serine protease n=1 Tax=Ignelater luminosus TaxID=2038154 RepID=A0A8K0D0N9_IGNLU|nr:hypothetical protein ILUMI_09080 [Ignelater luminosus]